MTTSVGDAVLCTMVVDPSLDHKDDVDNSWDIKELHVTKLLNTDEARSISSSEKKRCYRQRSLSASRSTLSLARESHPQPEVGGENMLFDTSPYAATQHYMTCPEAVPTGL